ncbi:TPA: helix-turn-helix domain-containing protein [Pluralibacter gergoviae]|uniref:helix-turn-helix domain-containing protein n=1 Tax=Pluralibacter gergoviae TaxID=61647 RepID=UPI000BFC866C|nr:hypothetical protein CRX51_20780 [Pluralibacter gergoviae]HDS1234238.1 helix-turn-helix domain-containing protein [Pluralibacter gergoviae]HDS1240075.1 helix-turn-helix domain-containing protein [Pluralibacter gergoviae]HDS1245121.1 helix-turn-helix domain-containing protein [Pluralibacter gergoviae]HDS1250229.1 helix-turn-helix domain-containing protein [Pluralibacter gergoviae]
MAGSFHFTSRTVFGILKGETELTLDNDLVQLRLVSAWRRLSETAMSMIEIACLYGFANSNHFIAGYKRVFGLRRVKCGVRKDKR